MSKSTLANKIGETLFNVASEQNSLEEVLHDLTETVKAVKEDENFITLMNNPNVAREKKISIIDSAFSNVNESVRNVIKILVSNLQISLIDEVSEQFTELYNRHFNKVVVKVESVYKLAEEQLTELRNKIKDELQLDDIEIVNEIDESLIGGLKITYNNKVIDDTIKAKLMKIKKQISNI